MVVLWRSEYATKLKISLEKIREILNEAVLEKVLEALAEKKISEGSIKPILLKIASGSPVESALIVESLDDNYLEQEISKLIKEKPGLRANAYMGLIIQKLGSSIDKKKSMELINRILR